MLPDDLLRTPKGIQREGAHMDRVGLRGGQ